LAELGGGTSAPQCQHDDEQRSLDESFHGAGKTILSRCTLRIRQ
jgi:hypothetical protein